VDLGPSNTSTLAVVALGVAVLALAIEVGAHLRLSGIQARYRVLWTGGEKDVAAVLAGQAGEIAHLRGESRTYAKGVVEGDSEVTLTPEEQQALAAARTGQGPE